MLQYHVVPSLPNDTWYKSDRPIGPISYYLSFLEFQKSWAGSPKKASMVRCLRVRS